MNFVILQPFTASSMFKIPRCEQGDIMVVVSLQLVTAITISWEKSSGASPASNVAFALGVGCASVISQISFTLFVSAVFLFVKMNLSLW